MNLANKTIFISGGSRGIGLAIAKRCAQDGANIAIAAKTSEPHPVLPGTVYSAAAEIEQMGGKALALICDIRFEDQVAIAVAQTVEAFGGLDVCINNASAIALTDTLSTSMKRYDLMNQVNARGTYLCSQRCLPHLKSSRHAHILNLSPPLDMKAKWFSPHVAYTIAKYGMSMCTLGMAEEFRNDKIAVNSLWPLTAIDTAAVRNVIGGDQLGQMSRKPNIMADAAYHILCQDPCACSGHFFIDEEVLRDAGVTDFSCYEYTHSEQLAGDLFVPDETFERSPSSIKKFY